MKCYVPAFPACQRRFRALPSSPSGIPGRKVRISSGAQLGGRQSRRFTSVRISRMYSRQPSRQQENLRIHLADENPRDCPPEPVRADGNHPDCSACSAKKRAHGTRRGGSSRLASLRRVNGTEADALISPRDCVAIHNPPFRGRGISRNRKENRCRESKDSQRQADNADGNALERFFQGIGSHPITRPTINATMNIRPVKTIHSTPHDFKSAHP